MSEVTNGRAKPDRWRYVENRAKFLPEDLLPYADQWVAWSVDGSKIVAHHEDLVEVARTVETLGLTREEVIFDFIALEGEVTTQL